MRSGRFWSNQVLLSGLLLSLIILGGGLALHLVTRGEFGIGETLYFSLITVSTIGYGEPEEFHDFAGAHTVIVLLIVTGLAALSYFQSALTALLVEGMLGKAFRRRRMDKKIAKLSNHIIVAGCGRTGKYCVQELSALKRPFVVIDREQATFDRLDAAHLGVEVLYVIGDATDDHALIAAGVTRAFGLVASLSEDRDNVFVVLSARTLNPKLRIVAKALDLENEPKLRKAGADKLVSPYRIGGFRLVSELVRPRTMEFLDGMQAMSERNLHMEDVELMEGCALIGKTLGTTPIRSEGSALVVAIREPEGAFIHNPPPDHKLRAHSHLIVVGDEAGVNALRSLASPRR